MGSPKTGNDYKTTPGMLKKYRGAALQFTNKIREALEQPALAELLPGALADATACVVTKSIEAPGLYPSTDYNAVNVFTMPLTENDEVRVCDLYNAEHDGQYIEPGDNPEDPDHKHLKPTSTFKVPADVQRFLQAFDAGYYPDLNVHNYSPFQEV